MDQQKYGQTKYTKQTNKNSNKQKDKVGTDRQTGNSSNQKESEGPGRDDYNQKESGRVSYN